MKLNRGWFCNIERRMYLDIIVYTDDTYMMILSFISIKMKNFLETIFSEENSFSGKRIFMYVLTIKIDEYASYL